MTRYWKLATCYFVFAACFVIFGLCLSGLAQNPPAPISSSSQLPPDTQTAPIKASAKPDWALTWSDEFDQPDGSAPDSTKWKLETGGNGWGNHELEYYTTRIQNTHVEKGNLVITAIKENYTGTDGVKRDYTSARLNTADKFDQKFGRFEARIKIPYGQGIWPAFWLLGSDIPRVGWPICGEIDIMENIGKEPSIVHGTIHGPGYSGDKGIGSPFTSRDGHFADHFHIYAVEWEPAAIRFYVDGNLYATRTPHDLSENATWVYNHRFFVILNLAVGGGWPGNPDKGTQFPQTMLVDYVRVYKKSGS
ncbi:MAG: Hydrolase [Acidobacteriaceae bacterium]|nr:Hydrolase [Acidobacteriaceae bacterium]